MRSANLRLLGIYTAISLLSRALSLAIDIFDIDESAHILGSWELLRGKLLYTDFVNNTPPLLYIYYALAQILFGRGMFSVHLMTALAIVPLTAFAASAFFNHSRTGMIAAFLFLLYSASFLAHDMLASNTEILMILPGAWAVVLVRDFEKAQNPFRMAAAGLLIGVGVLLKYQIVFWLGAIGVAFLFETIRNRQLIKSMLPIAAAGIGFIIPLLVTYGFFLMKGGAAELLYWTIQNNLGYSSNPILLSEAIGRAAAYLFPFLIATAVLWWGSARSLQLGDSMYRRFLIYGLMLFSLPSVFLGFRFYPHYFIQLYVPLALAAAPFLSSILKRPFSRSAKIALGYTCFVVIGFAIANWILYFGPATVYRERDPIYRHIAERLRHDACFRGGTLFVWGYAHPIYYYSELPPASRFVVLPQSGLTTYISGNLESVRGKTETKGRIQQKHWDYLISDLEKNQATYIVDTAPAGIYRWNRYPIHDYPRLSEYIHQHYQRLDSVENVDIYRRLNCR